MLSLGNLEFLSTKLTVHSRVKYFEMLSSLYEAFDQRKEKEKKKRKK